MKLLVVVRAAVVGVLISGLAVSPAQASVAHRVPAPDGDLKVWYTFSPPAQDSTDPNVAVNPLTFSDSCRNRKTPTGVNGFVGISFPADAVVNVDNYRVLVDVRQGPHRRPLTIYAPYAPQNAYCAQYRPAVTNEPVTIRFHVLKRKTTLSTGDTLSKGTAWAAVSFARYRPDELGNVVVNMTVVDRRSGVVVAPTITYQGLGEIPTYGKDIDEACRLMLPLGTAVFALRSSLEFISIFGPPVGSIGADVAIGFIDFEERILRGEFVVRGNPQLSPDARNDLAETVVETFKNGVDYAVGEYTKVVVEGVDGVTAYDIKLLDDVKYIDKAFKVHEVTRWVHDNLVNAPQEAVEYGELCRGRSGG